MAFEPRNLRRFFAHEDQVQKESRSGRYIEMEPCSSIKMDRSTPCRTLSGEPEPLYIPSHHESHII